MAHMSRIEKAKKTQKNAKKVRKKKELALAQLSIEEREELREKRNERDLKDQTQIALWDFNVNKVLPNKYPKMIIALQARKAEIDEEYKNDVPAYIVTEFCEIEDAIEKMEKVLGK